MQDGDAAAAVAQYEQVLKQDPNNLAAVNNLAWLLQKSDPKRSLALATLALKLSPDSPDIIDTLGWIKLQQNDSKGALELLNRAHGLRKADGEITYHLVLAFEANGNRNSAKGLLKALLDSGVKFDDLEKAKKLAASWQ
jgi:Flp pilus assembly protein TadD